MTDKINKFITKTKPSTPCVIIDVDSISHNYDRMKYFFPDTDIFYAVKASPGKPIIEMLAKKGSSFDAASIPEIERCLESGATPDRISFGNTVKRESDIIKAFEYGIRMFAFDSEEELKKIAKAAPGSDVYCRLLFGGEGADWPLSRKFGCENDMAIDLIIMAEKLGLNPVGISFHVGSQQRDVEQWKHAISWVAEIFRTVQRESGIELSLVNLGGGLPATYRDPSMGVEFYAELITQYINEEFGETKPKFIMEPGRSLVGDSGILLTEVLLVSRKNYSEFEPRWVFLDAGKFGGLAETMEEAIKYRIETPKDGSPTGPVILAGPTCDSADILYEKFQYQLPMNLAPGDQIKFLSAGAYTSSYSAIFFNGFAPLTEYFI